MGYENGIINEVTLPAGAMLGGISIGPDTLDALMIVRRAHALMEDNSEGIVTQTPKVGPYTPDTGKFSKLLAVPTNGDSIFIHSSVSAETGEEDLLAVVATLPDPAQPGATNPYSFIIRPRLEREPLAITKLAKVNRGSGADARTVRMPSPVHNPEQHAALVNSMVAVLGSLATSSEHPVTSPDKTREWALGSVSNASH